MQNEDGRVHLTYFRKEIQASYVWDGDSSDIEVSFGGYAEPVSDTIDAPLVTGFYDTIDAFQRSCDRHADRYDIGV